MAIKLLNDSLFSQILYYLCRLFEFMVKIRAFSATFSAFTVSYSCSEESISRYSCLIGKKIGYIASFATKNLILKETTSVYGLFLEDLVHWFRELGLLKARFPHGLFHSKKNGSINDSSLW